MPSKTAKQRRAMAAACKGKSTRKPKRARIPKKVACEFNRADKKRSRRR